MDKSLILNKIRKYLDLGSDKEFAKFLGIKPNTLSNWHSRNTYDAELLFTKCNFINAAFLLTGKGSMVSSVHDSFNEPQEVFKTNNKLKQHIYKGKRIPLIPIEAMAGFASGEMQVMEYDTVTYVVPEFEELNVEFMIRVKGSSMYPKYNSGNTVGCKKLPLDTFFQWNKVYVLDTIQGPLIKRVQKSDKEDYIVCVSDNTKYAPFDLPKSEIYSIAIVLGVIQLE